MKHCPECGKKLPLPNPKHCPECGVALREGAGAETPKGPLRRYWAWIIALVLLGIVFLSFNYMYNDGLVPQMKKAQETRELKLQQQLTDESQLALAQKKLLISNSLQEYYNNLLVYQTSLSEPGRAYAAMPNKTDEEFALKIETAKTLALKLREFMDFLKDTANFFTQNAEEMQKLGLVSNATKAADGVMAAYDGMKTGIPELRTEMEQMAGDNPDRQSQIEEVMKIVEG